MAQKTKGENEHRHPIDFFFFNIVVEFIGRTSHSYNAVSRVFTHQSCNCLFFFCRSVEYFYSFSCLKTNLSSKIITDPRKLPLTCENTDDSPRMRRIITFLSQVKKQRNGAVTAIASSSLLMTRVLLRPEFTYNVYRVCWVLSGQVRG